MGFDFPLGEFAEVDKGDIAHVFSRSCKNEVGVLTRKRDHIVYLIFFEGKGLDNVFDFEVEKVKEKNFVVKCYNYLVESDSDLFDLGRKSHVSDYFLCFFELYLNSYCHRILLVGSVE